MSDGNRVMAKDGLSNLVSSGQSPLVPGSNTSDASAVWNGGDAVAAGSVLSNAPAPVRLLAAREALGLSAKDVAARTRITLRHIDALEIGDYAALPGRPYALGFARAYARAVGLDSAAIADAVRAELEGSTPRTESRVLHQFEVGDPAKTPSRLVGWLALLLAAAFLAMGGVFWRSYYVPAVPLPPLAGPSDGRPADFTRMQAQGAVPAPLQPAVGNAVVFTALEEGLWVKFYDGQGQQLMQKQLAKGESYTVPADAASPKLWTGRPDALAITIGGQAVARLAETERVMKDVPVDAASLRARSQATSANPVAAPASGAASPAIAR